MTNTTKSCNTINLLSRTQYDGTTPSDTELWAVDENSDSNYKKMVVGWGMPDYTAGTSFTSGNTTTQACFVHVEAIWNGVSSELTSPFQQNLAGAVYNGSSLYKNDANFICAAGVTISFTNATCTVYPLIGG